MAKVTSLLLALGILTALLAEEGGSVEIEEMFVSDQNSIFSESKYTKTIKCGEPNTITLYNPYLYAKISTSYLISTIEGIIDNDKSKKFSDAGYKDFYIAYMYQLSNEYYPVKDATFTEYGILSTSTETCIINLENNWVCRTYTSSICSIEVPTTTFTAERNGEPVNVTYKIKPKFNNYKKYQECMCKGWEIIVSDKIYTVNCNSDNDPDKEIK